jgi:N-acetylneuraminic acid mutarotase
MYKFIKTLFPLSLLFLSISSEAQININSQWTWIKGDNTNNGQGSYGIQGIASVINTPGARYNSVGWTDVSNNLWLFGGTTTFYFDDLWKFNPSTNQWTWMKGDSTIENHGIYGTQGIQAATNQPGGRYYSNTWIDNDGNFWLFGGAGYAMNGISGNLNDLWKYDPSINEWTWMNGDKTIENTGLYGTKNVASTINKPAARDGGVSWKDKSGNLWLFGGVRNPLFISAYLNDVWKYNISTNEWTWINGDSTGNSHGIYGTKGIASVTNNPGGRAASISWTDNSGDFWLFGGSGFAESGSINDLNDLWKYDPISNLWTWISGDKTGNAAGVYGSQGIPASTNKPGGRVASSSFSDSLGNLFLFGGIGYSNNNIAEGELNDLWQFNVITKQWTWIKGDSTVNNIGIYGLQGIAAITNKPGSRFGNTSWSDTSGNLYLFGGTGYATNGVSDNLNDLWKLNLNNSVLPLNLLNFQASLVEKNVLLNWQSTEINTGYFIVEYSTNGRNFNILGVVNANHNGSPINNYSFVHVSPKETSNFYRLKIIDKDGLFDYSKIVEVKINRKKNLQIFPNPATDILIVQASGENEKALLEVFDELGKKVIEKKIILNGTVNFYINIKDLPKGWYSLKIIKQNKIEQEKFVKL